MTPLPHLSHQSTDPAPVARALTALADLSRARSSSIPLTPLQDAFVAADGFGPLVCALDSALGRASAAGASPAASPATAASACDALALLTRGHAGAAEAARTAGALPALAAVLDSAARRRAPPPPLRPALCSRPRGPWRR